MKISQQKQFLLVEPVSKTPYPPLGLMKISSMLKEQNKRCHVFDIVGTNVPKGLSRVEAIYITTLFTWDLDAAIRTIHFYSDNFPKVNLNVGGIAATLLPGDIEMQTGIRPHIGILKEAESFRPDYSLSFGRHINSSITFASRGCVRKCKFCSVSKHEPQFFIKRNWERDIQPDLPYITFWDNNWLASPNLRVDCEKIYRIGKPVDFNQGLDARLYDIETAKELSMININPMRFAFDDVRMENQIIKAIKLANKYSGREIRVYVLYNFEDTPEDFYYRINLMNKMKVLTFPMEYRKTSASKRRFPGKYWNLPLLRALKLSLLFYYRRGMITTSRRSLLSIYGKNPREFTEKLYQIFEYDKNLKSRKHPSSA